MLNVNLTHAAPRRAPVKRRIFVAAPAQLLVPLQVVFRAAEPNMAVAILRRGGVIISGRGGAYRGADTGGAGRRWAVLQVQVGHRYLYLQGVMNTRIS